MKDYLGKFLEIGDEVVFITPGYRDYSKGIIKRFTKCFVIVEYTEGTRVSDEIKQGSYQLIKI